MVGEGQITGNHLSTLAPDLLLRFGAWTSQSSRREFAGLVRLLLTWPSGISDSFPMKTGENGKWAKACWHIGGALQYPRKIDGKVENVWHAYLQGAEAASSSMECMLMHDIWCKSRYSHAGSVCQGTLEGREEGAFMELLASRQFNVWLVVASFGSRLGPDSTRLDHT